MKQRTLILKFSDGSVKKVELGKKALICTRVIGDKDTRGRRPLDFTPQIVTQLLKLKQGEVMNLYGMNSGTARLRVRELNLETKKRFKLSVISKEEVQIRLK